MYLKFVHQVGHWLRLYYKAWSAKHKKKTGISECLWFFNPFLSGKSYPMYLLADMYIIHRHQTCISGEYYETTGTSHNLPLYHEAIRSRTAVSNTVLTSIMSNWEYQHPTVLKLTQVTPAERMEVCTKSEIFVR